MSRNRAGRVVRCPDCKSAIRIPKIDIVGSAENEVIACKAKIAKRKNTNPNADLESASASQCLTTPEKKPAAELPKDPFLDFSEKLVSSPRPIFDPEDVEASTSSRLAVPGPGPAAEALARPPKTPEELMGVDVDSPKSLRTGSADEALAKPVKSPVDLMHLEVPSPPIQSKPKHTEPAFPTIAMDSGKNSDFSINTESVPIETHVDKDWGQRLESANADRKVLARFFAICMCLVALVNMVPAIYHWFHWTQLADNGSLPRWIYIQIFVGAIYLIYALFLAQIPDWSALRSVALAMLVMAFVFGFVSTGLLIGGGQGSLTGFLGIPYTLIRQACIWCVAMLCLATLMAYWGGKESSNWQRAEALLKDIMNQAHRQA